MRVDLDHYLILGVPQTADPAAIRAAYVALAKRYHPDIAVGDPELAASNFRAIKEAYETLSDPVRRAAYDAKARQAETMLARNVVSSSSTPPSISAVWIALDYFAALFRGGRRTGLALVGAAFLLLGGFLAARHLASVPSVETPVAVATRADDEAKRREAIAAGQASQPVRPRPGSMGALLGPLSASGIGAQKGARLELPSGQAQCVAGDGVRFSITSRNGEVSVVYSGDPAVRATVSYAGRQLMLLTGIVADDSIAIGVLRGENAGALVFHTDDTGKPVRTAAARCVGLAY